MLNVSSQHNSYRNDYYEAKTKLRAVIGTTGDSGSERGIQELIERASPPKTKRRASGKQSRNKSR